MKNQNEKPDDVTPVASDDLLAFGNACIAGDIHIIDDPDAIGGDTQPEKIPFALVIQFDGPEAIRKAMADRTCKFTVFGG